MDITVYLPDELGERVKAAEPKLEYSRMFRQAVEEELDRRDRLAELSNGMEEHRVPAKDRDGVDLVLRFTGKLVGGGFGDSIYLLEDGRVLVVYEEDYDEFADVAEFGDFVSSNTRNNLGRDTEEGLAEAAAELGAPRVIDL